MITKQTYKSRAAWLIARNMQPVLGSSDVGTIMGLNPYMTPYQYWIKQKEPKEFEEENENLYRGQFKEAAIAQMFAQLTGEKVIQRSAEITVFKNDRFPEYVQVAPDRELFAKGRDNRPGLECKDTRMYIADLRLECPQSWYAQIQFQMGVMERKDWYIAAEEGNKNLVYELFSFDEKAFSHIMKYCTEWFEKYILGDEVPPAETGADAQTMFPTSEPLSMKRVGELTYGKVMALVRHKAELKTLESRISELEDAIKITFDENEAIEYNGNVLATWKTQEVNRVDVTALSKELPDIAGKYTKKSSIRVLRLKKQLEK